MLSDPAPGLITCRKTVQVPQKERSWVSQQLLSTVLHAYTYTLHVSDSQLLVQSIHPYTSYQVTIQCCSDYCPPANISSLDPGHDRNTCDIPLYHPACDLIWCHNNRSHDHLSKMVQSCLGLYANHTPPNVSHGVYNKYYNWYKITMEVGGGGAGITWSSSEMVSRDDVVATVTIPAAGWTVSSLTSALTVSPCLWLLW